MDLQKLREERAGLFKENGELLALVGKEARPLSADEQGTYDARDARIESLGATITRSESHAKLETDMEEISEHAPVTTTGDEARDARAAEYASVFAAYLRRGVRGMTTAQEEMLFEAASPANPELRAQGITTGASGGFLVPQGFRGIMVEALKSFGGIAQLAEVITTDSGNTLPWPTSNETAALGAIIGENTTVADLDVTLGTANLGAFMYTSKMVKVSRQLMQDSGFALEPWLARKLGERIGRIQAQHFAVGTGVSEPQGLMTGLSVGTIAASATLITFDELIELVFSLDPAYRPRSQFVMGDVAMKTIRKVKDTTGQYLWQPSTQAGEPDRLLGYPVVVDTGIAAPAAAAKTVAFGDIAAAYVVRVVNGTEVMRLDERFAELGQTAFLGWARADAVVQDTSAAKVLRQA